MKKMSKRIKSNRRKNVVDKQKDMQVQINKRTQKDKQKDKSEQQVQNSFNNGITEEEKEMKKNVNRSKKVTVNNNVEGKKMSKNNKNADNTNTANSANSANSTNTTASTSAEIPGSLPVAGATQNEKYMWLNNAGLQIIPEIQRKLNMMRVEKIQKNYSPLIANPPKVSFRDGKYYIFDGMHTRTAMRAINGTDDFPIFCRVYYGLTEQDEARLFAEQFGYSEPVAMGYLLRALKIADDDIVLDFLKATEDCGFNVTLGSSVTSNGRIGAACTAYKAYCDLGASEYKRMMKILHRTWAGESWSVGKYMLAGMARFLKMYSVNANSFVRVFRTVTYNEIRAEVLRFTGVTKASAFATALAEIYERGNGTPAEKTA